MSRRYLRVVMMLCALLLGTLCVADLYEIDAEERGTLVLNQQPAPESRGPTIHVEIYSLAPETDRQSNSVIRKCWAEIEELANPQRQRFVSAHHDTTRIFPLQLIASNRSQPGTQWRVKLKPGKYLLAREIWWGAPFHAHSGFGYCPIEIKPGERSEYTIQELNFER